MIILPTMPTQKRYGLNSTKYQYGIAKHITIIFTTTYEENEMVDASKFSWCLLMYYVRIPLAVKEIGVITPNNTGIHAGRT